MKNLCKKTHKKRRFLRFKSFRVQMALTFIALMAICMLVSIGLARLYIISYYTNRQLEKIEETFADVNDYTQSYQFYEGRYRINPVVAKELDTLALIKNVDIVLVDTSSDRGRVVFSTGTSTEGSNYIIENVTSYITGNYDKNVYLMKDTRDHVIYRAKDVYTGSTNIDLLGKLDNGVYSFIRINYDNIENTASMASNYYAYVGIIVILVEAIVIMLILRRFIKPLESMNTVAKKMRKLDFEARVEADFDNEIGELATTLNSLSETLEGTILELKKANNELTSDIERHKEVDEMRKDFLDNVSHELKTPIAIIQGYAEGLSENINDNPEDRAFYCEVIMDEAAKMNNMVKKLLTLSRMEHGNNPLDIERFDVIPMIKGLLDSSEVLAGDKEVVVQFDDSCSYYVYADEFMIEDAISNFISNAYHYVSGENLIRITVENIGKVTRVSVYNSGSTIPEEDLDKVWIKFFKVDKARTREYGGSGIGLSIVKATMDLHNQTCGVRNVDNGVEFYLELDNSPVEHISVERGNDDSDN